MGSFFNGGSTQTTSQSTAPLDWQAQPVKGLFNQASNLANSQQGLQYNGQMYAGMNQQEMAAAGLMSQNGQAAYGYGQGMMGAGNAALGGLGSAMSGYGDFANGNFDQGSQAAGNVLAGNAQNGINFANAGMQSALSGIANNTAGNVVNEAGQYVNNDLLRGQIDAVGTDIGRNLGQQVNSLNATAALNGNMDSSRAGAAQGIYTAQAQQNLANSAANMRGNAYSTGLNLAEGQNVANINASLNAAGQGNQMSLAALQGQNANNAQTNAVNQMRMQGNAGLMGGAQLGAQMLGEGNALGMSGAQQMYGAGNLYQQNQQGQDNANLQQFMLNNETLPWAGLNNASNILQSRNWGGTQTGTTQNSQQSSPFGDILGGLSFAGSAFGGFGGMGSWFGGGGENPWEGSGV